MTQHLVQDLDLTYLSPPVLAAARNFADLKYEVDVAGRRCPSDLPNDLHGRLSGGEYDGPYGGETFINNILPFMPFAPNINYEELGVKYAPISNTLGCSWRWWPDNCKGDEEHIISQITSAEYGKDAYYYFIRELGIIYASEGKNRVNFCRHHKIEKIPVSVKLFHYPAANSIAVYYVNSPIGTEVIAVLNGQYLQRINHIDYALPLLNAYGVKVYTEWPTRFPSFEMIYQHAYYAKVNEIFSAHTIDLAKVHTRESSHSSKQKGFLHILLGALLK
ncbi:hypothetical protein [Aeromonas sp. Y311-2]|jgi:hypothetical protein|uniref:hypothetical protein n=1 Tax=Aeromonas sp. Y311-2 TaxID=2990507 RepID=UPI0022E1D2A0|nr:hypothetical protein [Aeromonas sp. Y311-2]